MPHLNKKLKVLFIWPNKDAPFFRPISLSLLSALLKRDGHDVRLFDTTFIDFGYTTISDSVTKIKVNRPVDLTPYHLKKKKVNPEEEILKVLLVYQPDLVAVTVLSDEVVIARKLTAAVKNFRADLPVIWGGKGVLVEPEEILNDLNVDYICQGEGIVALPEFVNALSSGKDPKIIGNIWYRENDKIIKNQLYPPFNNLDSLPYYDWSIFDERLFFKPYEGRVYRGGDHMISWGCPNDCTYCLNKYYHELYGCSSLVRYSPRRIIDELKYLTQKYQMEFYKFHDEDFLLKPRAYFEELADLYAKEVNIPFTCMANSKFVTEDNVRLLKKMNCQSVSLGVETGDQEIRRQILNRVDTHEEIKRAFGLLREAGIRNLAFNMMGMPFETRETFFKTVELNRCAGVQVPQIGFFFPFKKTVMRDLAIENGNYDPGHEKIYDPSEPALELKSLTKQELIALRERFSLYVKLPKDYWPYVERSEKQDGLGLALTDKLNNIYNITVFDNDYWYNDRGKLRDYLSELELIYPLAK